MGYGHQDNLEGRDVRQLDQHVSAALAKGVRYNMKILIRGQVSSNSDEWESGASALAS
jgi:hypothetical protein